MKKILSTLVMIALCLGVLSACGSGGDDAPALSGKYVCTSFVMGEDVLTPEQLSESGIDPETLYLEFIDASNFTMMMMDEETEGTYALNGNVLYLTVDEITETVQYEDDTISMIDPEMDYTIYFEKE